MLGVDLIAQLVAATEPLPRQKLAHARAKRHGGEECERGILAGVIAGRRPARLDRSLGDRIEALERRNERAGFEELDLEFAARHALEVLGEAHAGRAKMRKRAAERALHFPADLVLGVGGGRHHCQRQGRCAQHTQLEQAFRHVALLPIMVVRYAGTTARGLRPHDIRWPAWRRHKSLRLWFVLLDCRSYGRHDGCSVPQSTHVAWSRGGVKSHLKLGTHPMVH